MIFMLIRTALWGVAIIAAAMAFVWLKDSDGGVTLTLAGRAYGPFRLLETLAIVFAMALTLWLAIKLFSFLVALVRFFAGDETALSRFWSRSRERRGFDALSKGLIAMAEGDGRTAMAKARKAERLLDRPDLTRLLIAQSARAAGQAEVAKDYYKRLASDPGTSYVGVKGLLEQALKEGDKKRALKLADHAFTLKAREPEVLNTLFELQCENSDWEGARRTLEALEKAGAITRDVATRRMAVLFVADGRAAEARGEGAKARDLIARARRKAPMLIPAVVTAAAQLHADGAQRKAERLLRDAWKHEPHPDLAAAFAALAPEESAYARRQRFRLLTKVNQDNPETRLLTAELALADGDPGGARLAMGDVVETHGTARALALMAAIERADGSDEEVVRGWLARAIAAPRAAQWTCSVCGARYSEWTPICPRCGAFDTLVWAEGDADATDAERDAALLPVLMETEAPEDESDDAADDAAEGDAKAEDQKAGA